VFAIGDVREKFIGESKAFIVDPGFGVNVGERAVAQLRPY
jgi:hypothetical protein